MRYLLTFLLLAQSALAANYKTGIDLSFSGTQGVDWDREQFYYDRTVNDSGVYYIKAATTISASHNARNVMGGNVLLTGSQADNGTIRYKIDQERRNDQNYSSSAWPAFSSWSFSTATYLDSSAVLGAIGDNGGNSALLTGAYWTKGVNGPTGNEYHSVLVWDDDSWRDTNTEYKASDGAYHLFAVNPQTPMLKWEVTGSGQFYTTPLKNYWVPAIFSQTTYFSGTVTCTIRDINGNDVFYRINGGSFTDAGASFVVLDQDDFSTGSNTLEYYFAGNEGFVATRTVVDTPGFPSAGESHGHLLWGDEAGWVTVSNKLVTTPYSTPFNSWRGTESYHDHADWLDSSDGYQSGRRHVLTTGAAFNAIVGKWGGNSYSEQNYNGTGSAVTYIEFAKQMLLDNPMGMDPTGYEVTWPSAAIPNKELFYRGYWDVDPIHSFAIAYDIVISQYRSDQHASGLTPVQDYYVRDSLARWAWLCAQTRSGMERTGSAGSRGMWGNARNVGAIVAGMAMPSYSTRYYGTSGFDDSTTTTYPWCPFPTAEYTWKQLFFDANGTVTAAGYPDIAWDLTLEEQTPGGSGLWKLDGTWGDKAGYINPALCRHSFELLSNLTALYYPERDWPNMYLGWEEATLGTFYYTDGGVQGPTRLSVAMLMNQSFPALYLNNYAYALTATGSENLASQMANNDMGYMYVVYFDADFEPADDQVLPVVFSPVGGTYSTAQSVTLSTGTTGATIRYTTDGSAPNCSSSSTYSTPLTVSSSQTIRAIGCKAAFLDSELTQAAYVIGVLAPPTITPFEEFVPPPIEVTITSADSPDAMYYTIDGSTPTTSSTLYTAPFNVTETTTIKAIAVKATFSNSDVATRTVTVDNPEFPSVASGKRKVRGTFIGGLAP